MLADSWVFRVIPHPEESLGHFLGRFRRANHLSHKVMAEHLGVRQRWVQDWERPSRRRNPTSLQRLALSLLTDVLPQQLEQMQPQDPLYLPTRLCAACYVEAPVHRGIWQLAGLDTCPHHHLSLLNACPICGSSFWVPCEWEKAHCDHCGLAFVEMQPYQSDPSPA